MGTPLHRAAAARTQPGHVCPLTTVRCRVQPEMIAAYEEHVREIRSQLLPAALPSFAASGSLRSASASGSQAAGSGPHTLERCDPHVMSLYNPAAVFVCGWWIAGCCLPALLCVDHTAASGSPLRRDLPPFCTKSVSESLSCSVAAITLPCHLRARSSSESS